MGLSSSLWADYKVETSARFGVIDTGPSVKTTISPEVAIFRTLDDDGVQAVGLSYVGFHWSDATTTLIPAPPEATDFINRVDTHGRVTTTTLFLNYRYTLSLPPKLSLYICPKLGAAQARGSGTQTSYGGIAGTVTQPYSFHTSWKIGAEIELGANFILDKQWSARLGGALTAIDGESRPLTNSLKAFQGVAGLSFSF